MAKKLIFKKEFNNFIKIDTIFQWQNIFTELFNLKENQKYLIYFDNDNQIYEDTVIINNNILSIGDPEYLTIPFLLEFDLNEQILTVKTSIPGNHYIRFYREISEKLLIANRYGNREIYGEYDNIVFNTENIDNKIVYSKLPPLTNNEDDEGKILGIEDGIWQKIEVPKLNMTVTFEDDTIKNYKIVGMEVN